MTRITSGLPIEEQETVVQLDRQTKIATIYTSDSRLMNRLSKKYECTKEHRNEGKVVALEFKVPESYITFRSPRPMKKEADA